MRFSALSLLLLCFPLFAAPPKWELNLKDSDDTSIDMAFFKEHPASLVFLIDENFNDEEKSFAKIVKAFGRSLPLVPVIFVVSSGTDKGTFKATIEDRLAPTVANLSKYLWLHLKNKEASSAEAIRSQLHFVLDGEEAVARHFRLGPKDFEVGFKMIVIDSEARAVTLEKAP